MKPGIMRRVLSGVVAVAATAILTVPVTAAELTIKEQVNQGQQTTQEQATQSNPENDIKTFSDVSTYHWAYTSITKMVNRGLFSGTTTPVNGIGTFAPDRTMTRAEFVVVVVRALYKSELDAMPAVAAGEAWWSNAHQIAVEQSLLLESELDDGNLSAPMNRQEMSMVLARACEAMGEEQGLLISSFMIPDYNSIEVYYRDYIIQAYSKGMLCGIDNNGTFNPMGTLNRAQAATVLYRLVESSSRQEVDYSNTNKVPNVPSSMHPGSDIGLPSYMVVSADYRSAIDTRTGGNFSIFKGKLVDSGIHYIDLVPSENQTWIEDEVHAIPQVGDTVIKADGTQVVLEATWLEFETYSVLILGLNQGVDIFTGTTINNSTVKAGMSASFIGDGTPLRESPLTNEMYTHSQWIDIKNWMFPSWEKGDYDGEIRHTYWKWDAEGVGGGDWEWIGGNVL